MIETVWSFLRVSVEITLSALSVGYYEDVTMLLMETCMEKDPTDTHFHVEGPLLASSPGK